MNGSPMRIGMAVSTLGFVGGIEKFAFDLATALGARGHHLRLLHGETRGRDTEEYARAFLEHRSIGAGCADDLDVVYVHGASSVDELEPFAGRPLVVGAHDHDHTCLRRHRYLPGNRRPCHRAPGVCCVAYGCFVLRETRTHKILPIRLGNPFRLRTRLQALCRRAELVACSDYIARNLIAGGVPPERVHTLYAIPPESAREPTARPNSRSLLFVGQLVEGKGLDIAMKALTHMPAATLAVVGEGPSRSAWEALAGRLVPGRVHFHGYVRPEEMDEMYDSASVVVVPSRWPEPFGMVGIEAMRRGRPVVAADHGGIPEWMGDGGTLFTPLDACDLARAAGALFDDESAGQRALSYAREHFPHRDLVDQAECLLRRVALRDA